MQLGSSALANDATIPRRFTCDGEDLSPPLDWTDTPAETHSLVLLCDDPEGSHRQSGRARGICPRALFE